jgi:hypothetical protein
MVWPTFFCLSADSSMSSGHVNDRMRVDFGSMKGGILCTNTVKQYVDLTRVRAAVKSRWTQTGKEQTGDVCRDDSEPAREKTQRRLEHSCSCSVNVGEDL